VVGHKGNDSRAGCVLLNGRLSAIRFGSGAIAAQSLRERGGMGGGAARRLGRLPLIPSSGIAHGDHGVMHGGLPDALVTRLGNLPEWTFSADSSPC